MTNWFKRFVQSFLLLLLILSFNSQAKMHSSFLDFHYFPTFSSQWIAENHSHLSARQIDQTVYYVYKMADKHKIDPLFLLALIRTESTFNPSARSKVGAIGLMQVLPKYHQDKIKGRNIRDIGVNIEVGSQIIDACLKKHYDHVEKALYCYLGGPSKNYYTKVKQHHSKIRQAIVEKRFKAELPIRRISSFNNPRAYHKNIHATDMDTLISYLQTL